jgi:hypothetical protein
VASFVGCFFDTISVILPNGEAILHTFRPHFSTFFLQLTGYVKGKNGTPQRYAFILSDRLAVCGGLHKYCVTIDAVGRVADVRILELTCDRSYCINTRLFLSQFKEFDVHNHGRKAKGYDAISGATQSTDLTSAIVRRALMLYHIGKAQESHG